MKKLILAIIIIIIVITTTESCTDYDSAKKILEINGYVPIEIGGYETGADSYNYATKFTAINKNCDTVSGYVEKDWFSGGSVIYLYAN